MGTIKTAPPQENHDYGRVSKRGQKEHLPDVRANGEWKGVRRVVSGFSGPLAGYVDFTCWNGSVHKLLNTSISFLKHSRRCQILRRSVDGCRPREKLFDRRPRERLSRISEFTAFVVLAVWRNGDAYAKAHGSVRTSGRRVRTAEFANAFGISRQRKKKTRNKPRFCTSGSRGVFAFNRQMATSESDARQRKQKARREIAHANFVRRHWMANPVLCTEFARAKGCEAKTLRWRGSSREFFESFRGRAGEVRGPSPWRRETTREAAAAEVVGTSSENSSSGRSTPQPLSPMKGSSWPRRPGEIVKLVGHGSNGQPDLQGTPRFRETFKELSKCLEDKLREGKGGGNGFEG